MLATLLGAAVAGLIGCGGGEVTSQSRRVADTAITADCVGIVPASLGASQSGPPGSANWTTQSDDLVGHVAFGKRRADDPSGIDILWTLYPTDQGPTPAPLATLEGQGMWPTGCELSLQSQPSGFTGTNCANGQITLQSWNHAGQLTSAHFVSNIANENSVFAIDPSGGTVALHQYAVGATWHVDYLRFDKHGVQTANVPFIHGPVTQGHEIGPRILSLGINLAGHALVIVEDLQHGGIEGAWLERGGTSHPFFPTTVNPVFFGGLQFLPDGTLAVKEDQGIGWHEVFADLGRAPLPAPAWMQTSDHRFSPYFTIRGGRALAIANSENGGIDLVSSAGTICGQISLSNAFDNAWAVGRDGTLSMVNPFGDGVPRWWPQLLK